ncbi:DUF2550 family protein [Corynebacterium sp. 335C]
MTAFFAFLIGGVLLLAAVVAAALLRFVLLRSKGLPVAVRPLGTAGDGHGWRHGVLTFTNDCAGMYKLRSLRPSADFFIDRRSAHVTSRRDLTEVEAGFFDRGSHVIGIACESGAGWEFAVDSGADTALVAWIESSPSTRQTRRLPSDMERRYREIRRRGVGRA